MDFTFTEQEQAFRREVCDWMTAEITEDYEVELDRRHDEKGFLQQFSKKLAQKGWLTIAWPKEYGGMAGTFIQQAILNEEMGYHHAPELAHTVGIGFVGPTIMVHGTEEQKKKYLPNIATMDDVYCQGFTEPDAGSDVASLKTRAVEDGDNYVINGSKIFIGNAHLGDMCFLAARTDPDAERHRGISLFMVPMTTPGIDVKAIPTIDGHRINAIYFDDVVISKDTMVGEKNRGWYAMATTLDFERSGVGGSAGAKRNLEDLLAYARKATRNGRPIIADPVIRHRFAEFAIWIEAWRLVCWRIVAMQTKGIVPNAEAAMTSINSKTFGPRFGELVADVMGRYAGVPESEDELAVQRGRLMRLFNRSILTHPGGTPEILKNVLATRGLGLPRS